MNSPAKRGYLFGEPAGRARFETLAERAWLALPGTIDGKAEAYHGTLKPVYHKGEEVEQIREYSDPLLMFLLRVRRAKIEHRIITPEQAQQHVNGMRMSGNGGGGIFMG